MEDLKQEKYMEFQMLSQQLQELQKQLETLEEQRVELVSVKLGLEELKGVKEGTELFFPLSSGIFAKASLKDPHELLVNVGSNVIVSKDIAATEKLVDENVDNLKSMQLQMQEQLEQVAEKITRLEKELA